MRELKFRGWNGKRWTRVYTLKGMLVQKLEFNGLKEKWVQYTGFNDKKGVEIFEGDVITIDHFYHDYQDGVAINSLPDNKIEEVAFNESNGMWITDSDALYEYLDICEVVGDIYQHPELLK